MYSALLAGVVTLYVDVVLGALTGHVWLVFGVLWLYAMAVGGAVTGVAAAFGTVASALLTALPGGRRQRGCGGTCRQAAAVAASTRRSTTIVPQGSGVSLLRSISYFDGHGAATPLLTLAAWGAAGCVLAVLATACAG